MEEESEQRDQLGLEQPAHAGFEVSPKDKAYWAAWRGESVTTRDSAVSDDLQGKVRLMTISWHYLPKPARTHKITYLHTDGYTLSPGLCTEMCVCAAVLHLTRIC